MGKENPITQNKETKQKVAMGKRTKDLLIFLFFVLVSCIFWIAQKLDDSISHEISVPIKLVDVPEGVIITGNLPESVKLSVRAKGLDLAPYLLWKDLDTLKVSFRSNGSNPTSHVTLTFNQLQNAFKRLLPNSATATGMAPDSITYYYNQQVFKTLPVKLSGLVQADGQHFVTGYSFVPDSVIVYAPQSVIDTMTAAYTDYIELKRLEKGVSQEVSLRTNSEMLTSPRRVNLSIDVDVMTRQKIVLPVVGLNFPAGKTLRTFPSTVEVSYLIPAKQKGIIDKDQFVVAVTYAELLKQGGNRCHPTLNNAPDGIQGVLIYPSEVDYLLENVATDDDEEEDL